MELTFHSQGEFEDFVQTYTLGVRAREGIIHGPRTNVNIVQTITGDLTTKEVEALTGEALFDVPHEPAGGMTGTMQTTITGAGEANSAGATPEAPKRKRRTKAEIAADEAAAKAEAELLAAQDETAPVMAAAKGADELQEGIAAVQALTAQADTSEKVTLPAADPIAEASAKAQAMVEGYTPEILEQIRGNAVLFAPDRSEQMKEGRAAIDQKNGGKGFMAYNAMFRALGLSPNIATHNEDEVRLHRAAIAHLMAS